MYKLLFFIILLNFSLCNKKNEPLIEPELETKARVYQTGYATWYGPGFNGGITASGERYDMYDYSAAHRHIPLGTIIKVYNTENNKCVVVKVNDRGPVKKSLILDLSKMAAIQLEMTQKGSAKIKIEILSKSHNPLKKIFEVYANLGNSIKS